MKVVEDGANVFYEYGIIGVVLVLFIFISYRFYEDAKKERKETLEKHEKERKALTESYTNSLNSVLADSKENVKKNIESTQNMVNTITAVFEKISDNNNNTSSGS